MKIINLQSSIIRCQLMISILILTFVFLTLNSYSQRVGINTTGALPNPSALLDVDATPTNDKGILIPRVSLTNVNTYAPITGAPVTSLLVYNNNAGMIGGALGYWYWDGVQWVQLAAGGGGGNAWLILGNAGTVDGTNFLGTTDPVPLNFRVNGQKAGRIDLAGPTFLGYEAGNVNTGSDNTGIGYQALYSNTTAYYNTASGYKALYSNIIGIGNTANGYATLYFNTGNYSTATGVYALFSNQTGNYNTATGYRALYSNTTGYSNVAMGVNSLYNNTDRSNLVAVGDSALYNNGMGVASPIHATGNTAVGSKALYSNTTGYVNTATGAYALYRNTTGNSNTACGIYALVNNTTGANNTTCGMNTLTSNNTGSSNTAMGEGAISNNATGDYNTAIGRTAFITAAASAFSNSTALGANTVISASNQVRIGDNAVGMSIGGYAAWSNLSDGRFKTDINENVPGLSFILKLRPVTYHFDMDKLDDFLNKPDSLRSKSNRELKGKMPLETGFIAQEVEKSASELGFDFNGVDKPKNSTDYYSLRYAEFTVPLVKAVQEQQRMINSLKSENQNLKIEIETLKFSNSDYESRLKKVEEVLGASVEK